MRNHLRENPQITDEINANLRNMLLAKPDQAVVEEEEAEPEAS